MPAVWLAECSASGVGASTWEVQAASANGIRSGAKRCARGDTDPMIALVRPCPQRFLPPPARQQWFDLRDLLGRASFFGRRLEFGRQRISPIR